MYRFFPTILILISSLLVRPYWAFGTDTCEQVLASTNQQQNKYDFHQYTPVFNIEASAIKRNWLQRMLESKKQKISSEVMIIQNMPISHKDHKGSIYRLLRILAHNPELATIPDFNLLSFLKTKFKDSMRSGPDQPHYDPQVIKLYIYIFGNYVNSDPEILSLFKEILDNYKYLKFPQYASSYDQLEIIEIIINMTKFYVDQYPELLPLYEKQLTGMDDYFAKPVAQDDYKNQSVFTNRAIFNIVKNVSYFSNRHPSILQSLLKRLSMLYAQTHPLHDNKAHMETDKATLESLKKYLKPSHIMYLVTNSDPTIRNTLVEFFRRDFHSPSTEMMETIEELLFYKPAVYVRKIGIEILAGRELLGFHNVPYRSSDTLLTKDLQLLQPPQPSPSRLDQRRVQLIYKIQQNDHSEDVKKTAGKVINGIKKRAKMVDQPDLDPINNFQRLLDAEKSIRDFKQAAHI